MGEGGLDLVSPPGRSWVTFQVTFVKSSKSCIPERPSLPGTQPPDWAPWKLLGVPKHSGMDHSLPGRVACSVTHVGKGQGCQH